MGSSHAFRSLLCDRSSPVLCLHNFAALPPRAGPRSAAPSTEGWVCWTWPREMYGDIQSTNGRLNLQAVLRTYRGSPLSQELLCHTHGCRLKSFGLDLGVVFWGGSTPTCLTVWLFQHLQSPPTKHPGIQPEGSSLPGSLSEKNWHPLI